jgi:hypothetical protein
MSDETTTEEGTVDPVPDSDDDGAEPVTHQLEGNFVVDVEGEG